MKQMSQFGEIFKRIMAEQGYSVSSFSKLAELDRGWLYAIFSGKRKLSEQNLQKILNGNFFTQENSQQLRQAYYQDIYGEEQMERILFLQQHFSEFYHAHQPDCSCLPPMTPVVPERGYLSSPPEVFGAVHRILQQTQFSGPSQKVATNLPYELVQLDDLLYQSLRKNPSGFTLYRMIPMLQNHNSLHNLKALFSSLRYLSQNVHLYCYYTAQPQFWQVDQLFPYYLITPQAVLLLRRDGEQGMLIPDKDFCANMHNRFLDALKNCSEITFSYANALSFLSNSHEMYSTEYAVELGNIMTMLLDRNILQQYGSPRFTGVSREGIISSLLHFLRQQAANSSENFLLLSKQNVLDFLHTGTFPNIPADYMNPLSPKHRIALLSQMEAHLQNHPGQTLGILDERVFGNYGNEFSISLARQNNSVILCGQKEPKTGLSFVGECGLKISNAVLYHDFLNFFDYAKRNQYIYDQENSLAILRELLLGQMQKNACLSDPVPESSLAGEPLPPLYGEG